MCVCVCVCVSLSLSLSLSLSRGSSTCGSIAQSRNGIPEALDLNSVEPDIFHISVKITAWGGNIFNKIIVIYLLA